MFSNQVCQLHQLNSRTLHTLHSLKLRVVLNDFTLAWMLIWNMNFSQESKFITPPLLKRKFSQKILHENKTMCWLSNSGNLTRSLSTLKHTNYRFILTTGVRSHRWLGRSLPYSIARRKQFWNKNIAFRYYGEWSTLGITFMPFYHKPCKTKHLIWPLSLKYTRDQL